MSDDRKMVEVSRRSLLQKATVMVGGAAVAATAMTATSARADKMAQTAAAYQPKPKDGQQCDGCGLFRRLRPANWWTARSVRQVGANSGQEELRPRGRVDERSNY